MGRHRIIVGYIWPAGTHSSLAATYDCRIYKTTGQGALGGLSESQSGAVLFCIEGESRKAVFLKICQDLKIRVTCYLRLPNKQFVWYGHRHCRRGHGGSFLLPPPDLHKGLGPIEKSMEHSSLISLSESRLKLHTWSPMAISFICSFYPSKMMYRVITQSLAQATPEIRNGWFCSFSKLLTEKE